MTARDYRTEAKRWAKFPATILFGTGLIWLLHRLFNFDIAVVGQDVETGIGALGAVLDYVVVPLGCMVVGLGMLFLLRWSLWLGFFLPLYPLIAVSIDKVSRVQTKFAAFRAGGSQQYFGDAVMTALLVVALWAVFVVMVLYIWKSIKILDASREWLRRRQDSDVHVAQQPAPNQPGNVGEGDEMCSLLPDLDEETG